MSLSPGPYSYNRFAGIPRGNTLSDSYRAIYEAKRAKKDYDGDGKVESGTAEYMGSKDKAIKKAMSKSTKDKKDDKKETVIIVKEKKEDVKPRLRRYVI